jgi:uncharacterized membrane protein
MLGLSNGFIYLPSFGGAGCFSFSGLYLHMTALTNGSASVVVTILSLDMVFILIMVHYLFHE